MDKLYYSIGEVAKTFNVNTSLIRFWEKEFDVIQPQRNKKGNRLFTHRDMDYFHQIFHLVKEKGYTLQGAKDKLKEKTITDNDPQIAILKTLKSLRTFLLELKESI
ncbi:MAG: MerR family transcriptional regulator [Bacteroidales bacterium]